MWSTPPVWMSKRSPRYLVAIAEHSMCQPGKPAPHGESHSWSRVLPGGLSFQRAKSAGWRLSLLSTRPVASSSSRSRPAKSAYAGNGRDVEVHAVVDHVGAALGLERLDHGDLLGDVLAGGGTDVGLEHAEAAAVGRPLLGPVRGDVGGAIPWASPTASILSSPSSASLVEVADVGDVGDERDLEAAGDRAAGAAGRA